MPSFNLVDEPWIPVRFQGEGGRRLVGLAQAFSEQRAIAEIVGPSPLTTFTLVRLLLAIAHRGLDGPRSLAAWGAMLGRGEVDSAPVQAYLARWRHRFDLFDPTRPFYQDASAIGREIGPVSKLAPERACGNNATLFDHSFDDDGATMSAAEAAVQLLVVQAYALGGLVSVPDGADATHKSAKAAPLVKTMGVLVSGPDLGTLLARNLVLYQPGNQPFITPNGVADTPAWERDDAIGTEPRWPKGYTDLLTWQSRRIRLLEADGVVTGAFVFKGEPLPEDFDLYRRDPALVFRRNKDPKAPRAWLPMSFNEDKALWRDAEAFTRSSAGAPGAPMVLGLLMDALTELDALPPNLPLDVFGLASDQAKALLWRSEHLDWPVAYARDTPEAIDLGQALIRGIEYASRVARTLGGYTVSFSPRAANAKPEEEMAPLKRLFLEFGANDTAAAQAEALGAKARYWPALGPAFQAYLQALPAGEGADPPWNPEAVRAWDQAVRTAARNAFVIATSAFERGGRSLRARAKAEDAFLHQLNRLSYAYRTNEHVAKSDLEDATA